MIDNLIYKGLWFSSVHPDNHLHGTLKFDVQEGIELELHGEFQDLSIEDDNRDIDIICGFTTNGKKISLYRCFKFHSYRSSPGLSVSKFSADFVIVGEHYKTESDIKFNCINARINNLSPWLNTYGFEKVDSDFEFKKTEVIYKLPESITFNLSENIKGSFDFNISMPLTQKTSKINLEQKVNLNLKFDEIKHFDEILSEYFHFQNFLILGLCQSTHLNFLKLKTIHKQESVEQKSVSSVDVYFKQRINTTPNKRNHTRDFLFTYHDIESDFEELIKNWYSSKMKLKPIISILIDSFNKNNPFNENNFLNIAQALETYHRRFRLNEVLPKKEYKQKVNEILETVISDHKSWLKERLNFANEPTLHKRLEELLKENHNKTLSKMIIDRDQFIRDVKNSRNFYTHYDKRLEKKAIKGNELYLLTEKLRTLLICVLLNEMGFTKNKIESIFLRNEWRFFNHLLC